jgi:ATP-binding cassette subfamily B protein
MAGSSGGISWGRLAGLIAPHLWPAEDRRLRRHVGLALLCLIVAKLANIQVPFFLKAIVDGLGIDPASPVVTVPLAAILAYGAARLGAAAFQEARDAIFARVGERAARRTAIGLYRHLFGLSLRFHLERRSGELGRSIERGTEAVSFLLQTALFSLVPTILEFLLVIAILLARYQPVYALIVLVTILAYAAFTILTTEWRTKFRRRMNELSSEFSAQAVDTLINYEMVKAFTNERYEEARLDGLMGRYEDAAVRSQTTLSFLNAGQAGIVALGGTIIMAVAAHDVAAGRLTVGDLVLLNTFILQLYVPLSFLGIVYRQLKQSITDLERLVALGDLVPEIADPPDGRTLRLDRAVVRFADVAFAYDPRRPILDGVDFEIGSGRKLALVGPSGAGKSTVVRLLFRFYEVDRGAITIDGQDIRSVTQASLRAAIGLVPQDTVLFNDTIAANIAYGRPGADQEAIERAARVAQIHDFITSLPDGYRTVVGERGLKLSGGEKQRVAIARVVLKDPAILVLDEATSALDTRTEEALQGALQAAARGRTTLVIAHRLSTVVDADEILVLEQGRVVERGDHASLLAGRGLYHAMWTRQHEAVAAG